MKDAIERLLDHLEWANEIVLEALRASPNDDADALGLYAHVLAAEHLWLSRIHGQPSRHAVWPTLSLDQCAQLSAENRQRLRELVAGLDEAALRRTVRYRNSAGFEFTNSLDDVLLHIALHGQHHRGQIARRLRALGTSPPYTDFIAFARRDQEGGTLDAGRAERGIIR